MRTIRTIAPSFAFAAALLVPAALVAWQAADAPTKGECDACGNRV